MHDSVSEWSDLRQALSECEKLESFRIHLPPTSIWGFAQNTNAEIPYTIFSAIFSVGQPVPSNLQKFVIQIRSENTWDMRALTDVTELWDFAALDQLLSQGRFPRLRELTVEIALQRYKGSEAFDREISKALPILQAAGKLRVVNLLD